jgi:hypothetical protein
VLGYGMIAAREIDAGIRGLAGCVREAQVARSAAPELPSVARRAPSVSG